MTILNCREKSEISVLSADRLFKSTVIFYTTRGHHGFMADTTSNLNSVYLLPTKRQRWPIKPNLFWCRQGRWRLLSLLISFDQILELWMLQWMIFVRKYFDIHPSVETTVHANFTEIPLKPKCLQCCQFALPAISLHRLDRYEVDAHDPSPPPTPRQPLPSSEVYVLGHRYTQASNAFYCHPTDLPQLDLIINVKIRRTRRSGKMRLRTQQASVHFPSLKVTIFLSFFFKHTPFLLRIWTMGWNTQVITNSKVATVLILRFGKLNKQHFV